MTENIEPFHLQNRLTKTKNPLTKSFKAISQMLREAKKLLFRFTSANDIGKKLAINIGLLFLIVLIPSISEYATNYQLYSSLRELTEPLDPKKAGELSETLDLYTAGINENADEVALAMMLEDDSYTLSQQLSVNAGKQIDGPQRVEATYTVKQGETITQIAQKFDLHVGTILAANKIPAEQSKIIKPGTTLKIPSSDTDTSDSWLVALNRAEEAERKAAEQKRQEELRKLLAKRGRAYAATSSAYEGIDRSGLIVPISHNGISRGFGGGHTGIDYRANIGTSVRAAASGKVIQISSGWSGGYGNQMLVDHGGGRVTRYAHLSSFAVGVGQTVGQGQTIAYSGNTGRSTGPHLHFELIIGGRPVSPF